MVEVTQIRVFSPALKVSRSLVVADGSQMSLACAGGLIWEGEGADWICLLWQMAVLTAGTSRAQAGNRGIKHRDLWPLCSRPRSPRRDQWVRVVTLVGSLFTCCPLNSQGP